MKHLRLDELVAGKQSLPTSPTDAGTVDMIVVRNREDERTTPSSVELTREAGVQNDYWSDSSYFGHTEMQVSLMNKHVLNLVSGNDRNRWSLAGDNLVVDFDIGVENLPPGSRLAVGSAILEISAKPHRGCSKFAGRYGSDAQRFVNIDDGPERRFRGVYASVVEAGTIEVGSVIKKL
jgi:MOSC domain-containing protein YiiM